MIHLFKHEVNLNLTLDLRQYFSHIRWGDDVHDGDDAHQLHDVI